VGLGLSYRTTGPDGAPRDVLELVPFLYTATKFDGLRAWFQRLACKRRCRVLYAGKRFRCRRCYGLAYNSQREAYYQRAMRQAEKLRKRIRHKLGCTFDEAAFPPKPRRMHWRTYWRLEERYEELQSQGMGGLLARFLP
jgi:hypothetical protein